MAERPVFFVRHGAYGTRGTYDRERLTLAGYAQSVAAANVLKENGVGGSGAVISSDAPRAVETAGIIAGEIGIDDLRVFPDRNAYNAGHFPRAIRSMVGLVDMMLHKHGIVLEPTDSLVIVTHLPLIAALTGQENDQIENGSVHKVDITRFENMKYSPSIERQFLPGMVQAP